MSHKNARSILLSKDAFRSSHIFFEGCLRLLDDADVIAIFDKNVVNAFPARDIRPGAVDRNNILDPMVFVLGGLRAAGQKQKHNAEKPRLALHR
jgi:hypothetical protein